MELVFKEMRKNKTQFFILYLLLLLPFSYVNAARVINDNVFIFSLTTSSQNSNFDFSSNNYKTSSDQIGVNWYEPFSKYFHAGLEIGYINLSQKDNSISSAQFTSGEYAGLLLQVLPIDTPSFALTLNLNYRYNSTTGKSTNQETRFVWDEVLLFSEIEFQPTAQVGFVLAAEYLFLNGEQHDSGNITQITNFTNSKQHGYRFGLNFISNRTGIVGIEAFTGFSSGSRLYFSRKF